jgi:hypothetical protein
MASFIPVFILAIIFGSITLWRLMAMNHKERMVQLQRGNDGQRALPAAEQAYVKELEQRVQHLETIVCSVAELNAKLNRLASVLQARRRGDQAIAGAAGAAIAKQVRPRCSHSSCQRLADRFLIGRALAPEAWARSTRQRRAARQSVALNHAAWRCRPGCWRPPAPSQRRAPHQPPQRGQDPRCR